MFPTPTFWRRAATLALGGLILAGGLVTTPAVATPPLGQTGVTAAANASATPDPATPLSDRTIRRIVDGLRSLPPAEAALRARIIRTANGEIGTREHGVNCQKYSRICEAWCGVFTRWVWRTAGVSKLPRLTPATTRSAWWATYWGEWADPRHRLKLNRPGRATPGDAIVYGAPGTNGHIGIVLRVHADGTLTTAEGNYGGMVSRRHIDPNTATGGETNQHVYGYVSPVRIGS